MPVMMQFSMMVNKFPSEFYFISFIGYRQYASHIASHYVGYCAGHYAGHYTVHCASPYLGHHARQYLGHNASHDAVQYDDQ